MEGILMRMQHAVKAWREMIDRWIDQKVSAGKTSEELDGTLFIYGNDVYRLVKTSLGDLVIEPQEIAQVVVLRKEDVPEPLNMCRVCGLDYSSFKEAIQCCAYLD